MGAVRFGSETRRYPAGEVRLVDVVRGRGGCVGSCGISEAGMGPDSEVRQGGVFKRRCRWEVLVR